MKKFFKVLASLVLAAAILAAGYFVGIRTQQESLVSALPKKTIEKIDEKSPEIPAASPQATDSARFIVKSENSAVASETWTKITGYQSNITGSDEDEINLYTSAQKIDDQIAWDDGQKWVLEVKGADGYYTILNQYISNGSVYFEVNDLEESGKQIVVYIMSGVATTIKQYTYTDSGFEEKLIYTSGETNRMYSSVPSY